MTNFYRVIGAMSGTSLDGLDICYCEFHFDQKWSFKIGPSKTVSYNNDFHNKLNNARSYTAIQLAELHVELGRFIGNEVKQFIDNNHLEVDLISSHGHTIFHEPKKGITLQIGDLNQIANITNINTVGDFRTLDVAKGGQGAPLVPIGDQLLFTEFSNCINLGGIANISFNENDTRIAFDICPVNIVLNKLSQLLELDYDDEGRNARSGAIDNELLSKLNALPFLTKSSPKSLGIEHIEEQYFPIIESTTISVNDLLRTFVEHIAQQITSNLTDGKSLFTGGGTKNKFLMERIESLSNSEIIVPHENLIDFKEALIFAFLGVLKINDQINCLSSVTGAQSDSSSGVIIKPE